MELAIVMPAYNEAECISQVALSWLRVTEPMGARLIIVDDGSTDKTGIILEQLAKAHPRLLIKHQKNAGHGAAVMSGYHAALALNPRFVFQTDSDDQFPPEEIHKLWEKRHEASLILGYRKERFDPWYRKTISRTLRWSIRLLFQVKIKDANIPFRLIQADALKMLLQQIPQTVFAPNIFLSVIAAKNKISVLTVPITHRERKTGQVSIIRWTLLKVCFRSFEELWSFRKAPTYAS